jgi:hypothetical protein
MVLDIARLEAAGYSVTLIDDAATSHKKRPEIVKIIISGNADIAMAAEGFTSGLVQDFPNVAVDKLRMIALAALDEARALDILRICTSA